MSPIAKGLIIAALLAVLFVGWNYVKTSKEGDNSAFDATIALWATRYAVDPLAVQAIINNEQGTLTPPPQAWPIGDSGTSFGPMQIHKGQGASPNPGAIDDWEAAHGSVADSTGSYDYLSDVGNSLAIQIGVWNLSRCIDSAGGIDLAFTKYNAGLGATQVSDYGTRAFAYYMSIGGKALGVAPDSNPQVSDASEETDPSGDEPA